MVEALAPRVSRWWLAVALLAACPSFAPAQDDAKKKAEPAKADAKGAPAAADDEQGVIDSTKIDKQETSEVFDDPRAKALLKNTFKEWPDAKPRLTNSDFSAMRNMAANVVGVNPELMGRFLDQMVADLSKHEYIKAVIEPGPPGPPGQRARAMEEASQRLMEVINIAHDRKNQAFLQQFVQKLFLKLTPLLEGHLHSRIEAAILLASAATPGEVDVFIKEIKDAKQVVWVKHWSAIGLTNATDKGRVTLDILKGTTATEALLGFLDKEPATPWPVKLRVLQALGSIRLASTAGVQGTPDVAAYAFTVLADPAAKVDLRAWAAWCLGMLTVPGAQPYNFKLATYQIGRLAADLGDRMLADYAQRGEKKFSRQSDYTRHLTGLLLYQLYPALAGEDNVANSGLSHAAHPGATASRAFAAGLEDQLKKFGRAANDLLTAGGGQVQQARNDLAAQVAELKAFLDKNRPAANEWELFPGGPKLAAPVGRAPAAPAGGTPAAPARRPPGS
jgi:hypothetical protein